MPCSVTEPMNTAPPTLEHVEHNLENHNLLTLGYLAFD